MGKLTEFLNEEAGSENLQPLVNGTAIFEVTQFNGIVFH